MNRRTILGLVGAALLVATVATAGLSGVSNFAIQLQNADPDELAASGFDLVVTDYSRDGSDAGAYTPQEIASIHAAGKTVVAYLPVGELSSFRFYWRRGWREGKPRFIGPENPDWPGAYKARYWMNGFWDKVLQPHLDRILDAGFDGVWLDTVDAYWFWYLEGEDPVRSADRMAALVHRVAEYGRAAKGESFVVIANNGLAMIDDASADGRASYLADIDAVNVESLFYNYWSPADQSYRLAKLAQYAAAGKTIFNIEYIAPALHAEYFATLAAQDIAILGYPAAPDGALDELVED